MSLNDLIPNELKSDFAYVVDDFEEYLTIHEISNVQQKDYYGKATLMLTLDDSTKLLPLNTNSKLKSLINILGEDVGNWIYKKVGIRVKTFWSEKDSKEIRYLTFDLPQERLYPPVDQKMSAKDFMTKPDFSSLPNAVEIAAAEVLPDIPDDDIPF